MNAVACFFAPEWLFGALIATAPFEVGLMDVFIKVFFGDNAGIHDAHELGHAGGYGEQVRFSTGCEAVKKKRL